MNMSFIPKTLTTNLANVTGCSRSKTHSRVPVGTDQLYSTPTCVHIIESEFYGASKLIEIFTLDNIIYM